MNDLRTLFGSETASDLALVSGLQRQTEASRLRALVGAPSEPDGQSSTPDTLSEFEVGSSGRLHAEKLASLVGNVASGVSPGLRPNFSTLDDPVVAAGAGPGPSPASMSTDLTTLVGSGLGGPDGYAAHGLAARTRDLTAGIAARFPDTWDPRASASAEELSVRATPMGKGAPGGWLPPELARAGARPLFGGHRRAGAVNYLSIGVAVIAIVALVGTATLALVQRTTANPATVAAVSLREREAELSNEIAELRTASSLYDAAVKEARALAEVSAPVLAGLQGRLNAASLLVADSSRSALLQSVAAAVPVSVPEYRRGAIDEESLADVAGAIDRVRVARESLPALVANARDGRSQVMAAISAFRLELSNLGAAMEAEVQTLLADNDFAEATLAAAVTDAAARVIDAQQAGGDGLAQMSAFGPAVDALRADNERARNLAIRDPQIFPFRPSPQGPTVDDPSSGGGMSTPNPTPGGVPPSSEPGGTPDPTAPPLETPIDAPTEEPSQ